MDIGSIVKIRQDSGDFLEDQDLFEYFSEEDFYSQLKGRLMEARGLVIKELTDGEPYPYVVNFAVIMPIKVKLYFKAEELVEV